MKGLILLSLVAFCSAVQFDSSLNKLWNLYKRQHAKSYDESEETVRRSIWETNVQRIQKHNLEYDLGLSSYRQGLNKFSDMTKSEYKKLLGTRVPAVRASTVTFLPPSNVRYPDTVDWRTQGYVTPVKDQGACGSCWSFSATGSLEGQHFKKFKQLNSLSEQQLVDCSTSEGNEGCNGGWMDYAFQYVADVTKQNSFLDTESCYKYKAQDLKCKVNTTQACDGTQGTGFSDIKKGDEQDLLRAVATIGPISVAIDASQDSFQSYTDGVYDEPDCSSEQLDHGVLAVGYGTTKDGKDYWLVKNSWGTGWGNKGYIMMSRNKDNQCGIATAASYPLL